MTVVTGDAVVAIVDLTLVAIVGLGPVTVRVTTHTAEGRIARHVGVAILADTPFGGVRARSERKPLRIVIEGRVFPDHRVMACGTVGVEPRRNVRGIRRGIILGPVAGIAVTQSTGEDASDVALQTVDGLVRTDQRECSDRVIEVRTKPAGGSMACSTVRIESGRDVRWIGRDLEIGLMAGVAVTRGSREHTAHMALQAFDGLVRTGEREGRQRVIEVRTKPAGNRMAFSTREGESRVGVIGIGAQIVVGPMAGNAVPIQSFEAATGMTVLALESAVPT